MIKSLANSSITNEKKYRSIMAGSVENNADHLIAETVLTSTATSVTFDVSSLAAIGYKHLQIRCVAVETAGGGIDSMVMRFNGDSGANYAWHGLQGINSSPGAIAGSLSSTPYIAFMNGDGSANLRFSPIIIDILDFASTNKTKASRSISGAIGAVDKGVTLKSTLWNNTAAITSIALSGASGNLDIGSRFSLYASKG